MVAQPQMCHCTKLLFIINILTDRQRNRHESETHIVEAVIVHVPEHIDDVARAEGQFSLNKQYIKLSCFRLFTSIRSFFVMVIMSPLCLHWESSLSGRSQRWPPSCKVWSFPSDRRSDWGLQVKHNGLTSVFKDALGENDTESDRNARKYIFIWYRTFDTFVKAVL